MAITEIRDRDGKATAYKPQVQAGHRRGGRRRGQPHHVRGVHQGHDAEVGGIGRDAAGKTGTTDGYTAAWFAGYTPDLASAVSLGDPRGAFKHDLTGVTIGGQLLQLRVRRLDLRPDLEGLHVPRSKGVEPSSFTPVEHGALRRLLAAAGARPSRPPKPKGDRGRRSRRRRRRRRPALDPRTPNGGAPIVIP